MTSMLNMSLLTTNPGAGLRWDIPPRYRERSASPTADEKARNERRLSFFDQSSSTDGVQELPASNDFLAPGTAERRRSSTPNNVQVSETAITPIPTDDEAEKSPVKVPKEECPHCNGFEKKYTTE